MDLKEILVIAAAIVVLGVSIAYPNFSNIPEYIIYMLIILVLTIFVKHATAYHFEANITTKFWKWYRYGFIRSAHFKNPVPMFWIAPVISFIARGAFFWLPILEFDVTPRPERASRRHGLYRFTEMTDWHIAVIAVSGVITNLVLAIIAYLIGFGFFARLNIYFALWSLVPLSSLDGSKILFGSKLLWIIFVVITLIFFGYAMLVV